TSSQSIFFQAEDGIRHFHVTGVQTCALPIYDEDVLALELGAHRVELLLHRLLALLLARHDEGPADVAVLVEALAVLDAEATRDRSEEHTSELQSRENLVCRLLLEKKKAINTT